MIFHAALVVSFKAPLKIEMTNSYPCFCKALMEASFLTLSLRPHTHHVASDKGRLTERCLIQQLAEVAGYCLVSREAETQTKPLNLAFNGVLPASLLFHWKPPSRSLNSDVKNHTWAGNKNLPVCTNTLECWALNWFWSRGLVGRVILSTQQNCSISQMSSHTFPQMVTFLKPTYPTENAKRNLGLPKVLSKAKPKTIFHQKNIASTVP